MTHGIFKEKYRGYQGSIRESKEDGVFFGEVLFISDLVSYEGASFEDLEHSFHEAVDAYIENCQYVGKDPCKPCKGTLNVRLGADLHTQLAILASKKNQTINSLIKEACQEKLCSENLTLTYFSESANLAFKPGDFNVEVVAHA